MDKDGDLDLVIGNEKKNYLLENDGTGKFSDITDRFIPEEYQVSGETREADFVDINGDGFVDLYFANVTLFQELPPVQRMLIWHPESNSFVDETLDRLGFSDSHSVVDADFRDIDLDGDVDLVYQTLEKPRIFLNNGSGKFIDMTEELFPKLNAMGIDVEIIDLTGDGKPDLYFGNFRTKDFYLIQK